MRIESLEVENSNNATNAAIAKQKLAEYEQLVSEKEVK